MEFWLRLLTFSLPAGRVMGIPLRINWILLIYIPFFIGRSVPNLITSGSVGWVMLLIGIICVVILYGSILLHELGHAWGMRLVGESCKQIQLTPIGGVALGGGGNHSPRSELIVIGLGPAVTAVLAIIGWIGLAILDRVAWGDGFSYSFFVVRASVNFLYWLNLALFLFNVLLPIFPLDSSKLVRAAFSFRFDPQRVTYYVANGGIGLGVLILFTWLAQIPLPFIGVASPFLFLIVVIGIQACLYELRALEYVDVYTTYDRWSNRPVYYDTEVIDGVRRNLSQDLGPLAAVIPGVRRRSAPRPRKTGRSAPPPKVRTAPITKSAKTTKAKTPGSIRLVIPDPDTINDPDEVRSLMEAAAEAEDFAMAAKLKRRLRELTNE